MRKARDRKKSLQRRHAALRAQDRFEITLTQDDFAEMAAQILKGEAERIERASNSRTLFWVQLRGKRRRVAWDKGSRTVCSVLPDDPKDEWA